MPINSVEMMQTIDERELQKKNNKKNSKRKTNKGRKEQGEQKL